MDSLVLEELTKEDRQLLETSLKKYHASKQDTQKINALANICENMMHPTWNKYQFYQYELIKQKIKSNTSIALKRALANALNNIGYIYEEKGLVEETLDHYNKSLNIKKELDDKKGTASSLVNIGYFYFNQGLIKEALDYYAKSLKIYEQLGDINGIANTFNNIGLVLKSQGRVKEALKYYDQSLKISKQIGDKYLIATALNNLGAVSKEQGQLQEALEYYNSSFELRKEIGDKSGIANSLNNIGAIYSDQGNQKMALYNYENSLALKEEIGDKKGIAFSLSSIGNIYSNQNQLEKALEYHNRCFDIYQEIGHKEGIAHSLINLGVIYHKKDMLNEAMEYSSKSLKVAKEIGYPKSIHRAASLLSEIYEQQGRGIDALKMHKLYVKMRDSINNEEIQKTSIIQQTNYEYEKLQAVKDKAHEKQLEIEKEAKSKQKVITYSIAIGSILIAVFLLFVINRLKVTRQQKAIIEEQKNAVEHAHKQIKDSINYAKRIQSAILPPVPLMKEYLNNCFVLYKPKDVVAGDFYWIENIVETGNKKENTVLFAAADCTGHGVPGAILSVVCNNALNSSVREHGIIEPGLILDKTREIVIQEFEKAKEQVRDGMDIALCSIKGNTLKYAGANNPLWIIRKGELIETKGNKQSIGNYGKNEPYQTHAFELEKGDSIYLFSDGFEDQYGEKSGTKFKAKALGELLISIQDKSMEEQNTIIDEAFESWRGSVDQIDDVCVIGVRI